MGYISQYLGEVTQIVNQLDTTMIQKMADLLIDELKSLVVISRIKLKSLV